MTSSASRAPSFDRGIVSIVPRLLVVLFFSTGAARAAVPAYVGSAACRDCHTYLYRTWERTWHSRSVLSAEAARQAGYPLPRAYPGGAKPDVAGWEELSYVFGGRQRIAYVDRQGMVLPTAYHNRTGKWRPFPAKPMDCAPCHVTGPATDDRPWAELNVGCEACHGPGGRHVASYEASDIVVDPSSRACGRCHTSAGRVLPADDLHAGHDTVQTWNLDSHVRGSRFHSHNAFCSTCHSPTEGLPLDATEASAKPVFAEHKLNVTCIACHDPHELSHDSYSPARSPLDAPAPPRSQIYRGDDGDFTTIDYVAQPSTEQVCTACHRGADRIELDHGDATCNDCHNPFMRQRGHASAVLHDANHPRLSCRPCHADADHRMAILYGDPVFLQPRYIHDLRRLPAAAVEKYGLTYPGLRRASVATVGPRPDEPIAVAERAPPAAARGDGIDAPSRSTAVDLAWLGRPPHAELARTDAAVRTRAAALAAGPGRLARWIELAEAYVAQGATRASRDLLARAALVDDPRLLLDLPLTAAPRGSASAGDALARARATVLRLLPADADAPTGRWLTAYLLLSDGRFALAEQALSPAGPDDACASFYRGLARLGQRRFDDAGDALEQALRARPRHRAARVALGLVALERRWLGRAVRQLTLAIRTDPRDPVAHYLIGRGQLRRHDAERAVVALEEALALDPGFEEARYLLARAQRLAGRSEEAIRCYRRLIEEDPARFRAHFELGLVYKWLSDQAGFELSGLRESDPAAGGETTGGERVARLSSLAAAYSERALAELAQALRLRPYDLEATRQVGELYRRAGRLDEALECFQWLAQRLPLQWVLPYRIGTIRLAQGLPAEAIAPLERALRLQPPGGDVHLALGLAHLRAGRLARAIEVWEAGRVRDPFDPALHTNLGAAYARQGELDLARRAYERALELRTFPLPRQHLSYLGLAIVELREGHRDAARAAARNALQVYPGDVEAHRLLTAIDSADAGASLAHLEPPVNDMLEIFGEVTTVAFGP